MSARNNRICMALGFLAAFLLWTAAVCLLDVQAIGPQGSKVGLAGLNGFFHRLTGVHMVLYHITDWLSVVPLCFVLGFALMGLGQWLRRKQLRKVNRSLLVLGGFYSSVMAGFVFFQQVVVNYRPVLIRGVLEVSCPSSTTLLVLCVMPTAMLQLKSRIKNVFLRRCTGLLLAAFTLFMVTARLISGVHWFTDILGGALLSAALVTLYYAFAL